MGTPTNVTLTSASLGDDAGRQSNKADFGANRPAAVEVRASEDFTGETPVAGTSIDYFLAPSNSGTAAQDTVAGNSGVDAAAPGSPIPSGMTLDEFLLTCAHVGSLPLTDDAAVQTGVVSDYFELPARYGQLIKVNRSGDVMEADDVESHVVFTEIKPDIA